MTDDLDALESDLWHSDAASALTNRASRAIIAANCGHLATTTQQEARNG